MFKDPKSLANNKASAWESRGFVITKKRVCILTHPRPYHEKFINLLLPGNLLFQLRKPGKPSLQESLELVSICRHLLRASRFFQGDYVPQEVSMIALTEER